MKLSRRSVLRLMALATIGVTAAAVERAAQPIGLSNLLRWRLRGQQERLVGRPPQVALGQCPAYDAGVLDCLRELWHQAGMPDVRGRRILVKPNLIDSVVGYPATTHGAVVGAVLDLMKEMQASHVVVGDGPGFRREAWAVAQAVGLAPVLEARQVPFVDLNYDDPQPVRATDGWFHNERHVWLPRHVREADLTVSVPKLKTHHWAGVSLSLKNLFGVVPGVRYGWPKNMLHINGLAASILGVYQLVRPTVSVVDGIVGMEGDGPLFGTPVAHGLMAVGYDAVAVDAVCTRLMGFSIEDVGYLKLAGWAGVGRTEDIEIVGSSSSALTRVYEPPPSI